MATRTKSKKRLAALTSNVKSLSQLKKFGPGTTTKVLKQRLSTLRAERPQHKRTVMDQSRIDNVRSALASANRELAKAKKKGAK